MSEHVIVWLDHKEARIFQVTPDPRARDVVQAPLHSTHHRHPGSNVAPHPQDEQHFFAKLVALLHGADAVLLVGPSTAKLHFINYVHSKKLAVASHIVGVETVDHPNDGQLVAYAQAYFAHGHPTARAVG
jgi:stalled ribosome rescue protein Dom34